MAGCLIRIAAVFITCLQKSVCSFFIMQDRAGIYQADKRYEICMIFIDKIQNKDIMNKV